MLTMLTGTIFAITRSSGEAPAIWVFILLFVASWIAVAFFLSLLGGWGTLVEHYRATQPFVGGISFRFQSAQLRSGTNYNGSLNIGANAEGLYLSPMVLFRAFHPPLFIPWNEIQGKPVKLWRRWDFVELRFQRTPTIPVKVRASLAEEFERASAGTFRVSSSQPARI